jgi:hypothetical protein
MKRLSNWIDKHWIVYAVALSGLTAFTTALLATWIAGS